MERLTSFNQLKDGDKIISPIDNEVTGFRIDKYDGERYLTGANSAYPIFQFDPSDFYIYLGEKNVGAIDNEWHELKTNERSLEFIEEVLG